MSAQPSLPARFLRSFVRGYQLFVSPLIGPRCRFYPNCSDYACEALTRHGAARGLSLTFRRLVRCHPFTKTGFHDPVPDNPALRIDWARLIRYNRWVCKKRKQKDNPTT